MRRCESLSFKHHEYIASLPPDEQREWLDRAVRGSRLDYRRAARVHCVVGRRRSGKGTAAKRNGAGRGQFFFPRPGREADQNLTSASVALADRARPPPITAPGWSSRATARAWPKQRRR